MKWKMVCLFLAGLAVMIISGCTQGETTAPEVVQQAISTAESEEPHAKLNISIRLEATTSTWIEDAQPYDIYIAIKQKLEKVGFEIVSSESVNYDAKLAIDYKEEKGPEYFTDYGTKIRCNIRLLDKAEILIYEVDIYGSTPIVISIGVDTYHAALAEFQNNVRFKYFGEIIVAEFGIGDEVIIFINALEDQAKTTREQAVGVLGRMGDARAVEPLIQALEDEEELVRQAAATALGEIGDTRAVEPLIQTLKDEGRFVRISAANALGEIGDARAVEALTQALQDEDEFVRRAAELALSQIKGD